MTYKKNGKTYQVQEINFGGAIVNVNGTSITNMKLMAETMKSPYPTNGYSVFVDSNELAFETFDQAYEFATTKQKDTYSL